MNTYKLDRASGELVPIDDWHNRQAKRHQQNQIAQYIEPDPEDIMPYSPDSMVPVTQQSSTEKSSPKARARAFLMRYAGLCALYLPLSFGAVWVVTGTVALSWILGVFGFLGATTFIVLTKIDYQHTVAGTERQRTIELGQTLRQQIKTSHDERMTKMKLDHEYRMEKMP